MLSVLTTGWGLVVVCAAGALAGISGAWWSAGFACRYALRLAIELHAGDGAHPGCGLSPLAPWLRCGASMVMGGLAWILAHRYGLGFGFWSTLIALNMLLILAVVDAQLALLPDALTAPLLWLGLAAAWMGGPVSLHQSLAGAVAGYGFLWVLFWLFALFRGRAGMGYGDFKLLAALGAWVGIFSLPYVLLAACLAGIGAAFLRQKNFRLGSSYPFGPFLAASGATALALGPGVQSYF